MLPISSSFTITISPHQHSPLRDLTHRPSLRVKQGTKDHLGLRAWLVPWVPPANLAPPETLVLPVHRASQENREGRARRAKRALRVPWVLQERRAPWVLRARQASQESEGCRASP